MLAIWSSGLFILGIVLTFSEMFLIPDLRAEGPGKDVYGFTLWLAGALAVVLTLVQLGIAAFKREGKGLGRALIGAGQFVVVCACWFGYCTLIVAACGALSRALMESLLGVSTWPDWEPLGGMAGAAVLYVIATGKPGFELGGFASNGYAENSPGGYSLEACLVAEVVLTFMFLMIILGATDKRAPQGFAPIAIGLALTLFHLVAIPVSNASLNPARSTATAIFGGAEAWGSLWLFWVAPIVGAILGALVYRFVLGGPDDDLRREVSGDPEAAVRRLMASGYISNDRAERDYPKASALAARDAHTTGSRLQRMRK